MKKPPAAIHARPNTASRRIPRSRTEAAVELVRLEFDGARLDREQQQSQRRADVAAQMLGKNRARAARLAASLVRPEGDG